MLETTAPLPRLEMRWRKDPKDDNEREKLRNSFLPETWFCDYGLVMPLNEHDIRRTPEIGVTRDTIFHLFSTTMVSGGDPWPGQVPYRDGAHAKWDAQALNNLPIWVLTPDGSHMEAQ